MDLTDPQWLCLQPLLPHQEYIQGRPATHVGRPRLASRPLLDGVFYKLRTSAPWYDLPGRYPAWQTCYANYRGWQDTGVMDRIFTALLVDLRDRGRLDLARLLPLGSLAYLRYGFNRFLQADPRWDTVWQLSTALLIFAVVAGKVRPRTSAPASIRSRRSFPLPSPALGETEDLGMGGANAVGSAIEVRPP